MVALRPLPADALLSRPTGLVVLPSGKLCVAGAHGLALLLESGKRSKQQLRKVPPLEAPTGLACSDSALFVACKGSHRVFKLDLHDNFALVASAGGAGSGPDQLASPQSLALVSSTLFVCDTNNHRVVAYHSVMLEPTGVVFGSEGSGEGELSFPHGLAVLDTEELEGGAEERPVRLLVTDTHNHRLCCFSLVGEFLWARGGHGTAPGCFDEPSGVAVARGVIAVAERARVQLLTREGAPLRLVPLPGELAAAGGLHSVCLGARHLYTSEEAAGRPLPAGQLLMLDLGPDLELELGGQAVEAAEGAGAGGVAREAVVAEAAMAAMEVSPPVGTAAAVGTPAAVGGAAAAAATVSSESTAGSAKGGEGGEDEESESVLLDPDVLSCLFEGMELQAKLPPRPSQPPSPPALPSSPPPCPPSSSF
jgi:hypothetical protein